MLLLVLLISITSQLLVVKGFSFPPEEFIVEHPEYRNRIFLFGTENELKEAKSINKNFSLQFNAKFL